MLWWLSPAAGWDVVVVNCKKGALLKINAQPRRCQVYGMIVFDDIVWLCLWYLTWHDFPPLVERESYCILLLLGSEFLFGKNIHIQTSEGLLTRLCCMELFYPIHDQNQGCWTLPQSLHKALFNHCTDDCDLFITDAAYLWAAWLPGAPGVFYVLHELKHFNECFMMFWYIFQEELMFLN